MTSTLDAEALERLRPMIELELQRRLQASQATSPSEIAAILRAVFVHLCGIRRTRDEQTQFLAFAAPIGREVAIGCVNAGLTHHPNGGQLLQFDQWFRRVESFDPLCTRMIDLFYFGGLSARSTAAILGVSRKAVVRELRFAKAWWQEARLRSLSCFVSPCIE